MLSKESCKALYGFVCPKETWLWVLPEMMNLFFHREENTLT